MGQLASALDHPPCLCEVIERYPGAHSAHFLWWKSLTLHFAASFILTVCAFLLGGRACAHLCAALERLVGLGVSVPVIVHDATFAFLSKLFAPWVDTTASYWQGKELKKVVKLTQQLNRSLKVLDSHLCCIHLVAGSCYHLVF